MQIHMGKLEKICLVTGVASARPDFCNEPFTFGSNLELTEKYDLSETYNLMNYEPPDLDRRGKLITCNNCFAQEC